MAGRPMIGRCPEQAMNPLTNHSHSTFPGLPSSDTPAFMVHSGLLIVAHPGILKRILRPY